MNQQWQVEHSCECRDCCYLVKTLALIDLSLELFVVTCKRNNWCSDVPVLVPAHHAAAHEIQFALRTSSPSLWLAYLATLRFWDPKTRMNFSVYSITLPTLAVGMQKIAAGIASHTVIPKMKANTKVGLEGPSIMNAKNSGTTSWSLRLGTVNNTLQFRFPRKQISVCFTAGYTVEPLIISTESSAHVGAGRKIVIATVTFTAFVEMINIKLIPSFLKVFVRSLRGKMMPAWPTIN